MLSCCWIGFIITILWQENFFILSVTIFFCCCCSTQWHSIKWCYLYVFLEETKNRVKFVKYFTNTDGQVFSFPLKFCWQQEMLFLSKRPCTVYCTEKLALTIFHCVCTGFRSVSKMYTEKKSASLWLLNSKFSILWIKIVQLKMNGIFLCST